MSDWAGYDLSFESYHAIPARWSYESVIAEHRRLGGTFDIAGTPRQTVFPNGIVERRLWYNLADGARAGDAACVELAVRFIEEHFIVSYSGYARARLARALKRAALSPEQKRRLSTRFLALLKRGERCHEFESYLALWPVVINDADRKAVQEPIAATAESAPAFHAKLVAALA